MGQTHRQSSTTPASPDQRAGIVVWYDPEKDYTHAIEKLALPNVTVCRHEDGFFRLREKLEPVIEWVDEDGHPRPDGEVPPRLLNYVPIARAASEFALIEMETAGAASAFVHSTSTHRIDHLL